jgi:hypothetical protein
MHDFSAFFHRTGSELIPISPPGGVTSQITDFLFVINVNFCSITYRFRVIRDLIIFYETGSNVTPISPPGGVTSQIKWLVFNANFCSITYRFRVIRDLIIFFMKPEVT